MRKVRLSMKELMRAQILLGLGDDKRLPMHEIADAITENCKLPELVPDMPGYKRSVKFRIYKYLKMLGTNTNFAPRAYVYFIQIGQKGLIKIGVATNVEARLKNLQTANPDKLNVIAKIGCKSKLDAYTLENDLHKKFSYLRKNGEWFYPRLLKKVKDICDEYEF